MTRATIELAGRIPIQLSPGQTRLVLAVLVALGLAVLAVGAFEAVFGALLGLVLRLTGHPPPRKSAFLRELDKLDERLDGKRK